MPNDVYGIPVPQRLERVFTAREKLLKLIERIDVFQSELGILRTQYPDVKLQGVMDLLEQARIAAQTEAPAAPCDCHHWQWDCPKCGGKKWLNGAMYLWATPALPMRTLPESLPSKVAASSPSLSEQRRAG